MSPTSRAFFSLCASVPASLQQAIAFPCYHSRLSQHRYVCEHKVSHSPAVLCRGRMLTMFKVNLTAHSGVPIRHGRTAYRFRGHVYDLHKRSITRVRMLIASLRRLLIIRNSILKECVPAKFPFDLSEQCYDSNGIPAQTFHPHDISAELFTTQR